jgi:hypothetical protein
MAEDTEHFFMYLIVICTASFENYLCKSFVHLLVGLFVLLMFNFLSFLYVLDIIFVYSGILYPMKLLLCRSF